MLEFHQLYPHYQFKKNKGYATLEHKQALLEYGPCEIHRMSFEPVRDAVHGQRCTVNGIAAPAARTVNCAQAIPRIRGTAPRKEN